ncbi:TetR/AcrR family transcriptional regulator, partial [Kitasatospora kazusensis]|uniref:TetR/AcrR family transcriptional regulator n=1 Tax=Kitasatospora kazusensis TaxID=407974 RepID=UPI0031D998EF
AALVVFDERGADLLTLAAVAARTKVATPSLYKHVRSLAELRALAAARVRADLGAQLRQALLGRSGEDAVVTLLRAHQEFADRHPHRYALAVGHDDPGPAGSADQVDAVLAAALRGYGLEPDALRHTVHALRTVALASAALGSSEAARLLLAGVLTAGLRSLAAHPA